MANDYSKILELANKNNMGLSNTIKRDYGIPLDYSSVQESYEAALDYAKNSALAYIGQPISIGDTLYIVTDEAGGYLKPVGSGTAGSVEYTVRKELIEGKTVYKLLRDRSTVGEPIEVPNAYDDTDIVNRISENEAVIVDHENRLTGVESFFESVENSDAVIDTLAEIQKYIGDDQEAVTKMLQDIKSNTDAISILNSDGVGSVKNIIEASFQEATDADILNLFN